MGITYKAAQENIYLRQPFLNVLFQKNPCDSVSKLVYDQHGKPVINFVEKLVANKKLPEQQAQEYLKSLYHRKDFTFLVLTYNMVGVGDDHQIFVTDYAFEKLNETDLTHMILDHEYFHSKDFKEGVKINNDLIITHQNITDLQESTLESVIETRAYIHQIRKAKEKGMVKTFAFANTVKGLSKYQDILMTVKPQNDFERKVIETQILSYQQILPIATEVRLT